MVLVMTFMSCAEEDPVTYQSVALTDTTEDFEMLLLDSRNLSIVLPKSTEGQTLELGAVVAFAGAPKSSSINYSYKIVEPATLPAGLTVNESGTIESGQLSGKLPITVDLDAFVLGEPNTLSIQLTDSDAPITNKSVVNYTFTVICPSELSGTFDAVATSLSQGAGIGWDNCDGVTWSGTVEIEAVSDGVYNVYTNGLNGDVRFLDLSFGAYYACYESAAETSLPAGNLMLQDVCNKLSFIGASQWGEVYSFTKVEPNGKDLRLGWSNDYGEGGEVVLTRTDGNSWSSDLRF